MKRTRIFQQALTNAKRQAYHELRRYTSDSKHQSMLLSQIENANTSNPEEIRRLALELAYTHASTRERFHHREEFYRTLLVLLGKPRTILDVGCGLNPLLHPLDKPSPLTLYVGADKDPNAIAAVGAYARSLKERRLMAVKWNISEGWKRLISISGISEFDVAYLFKLVPVIQRQSPELLRILSDTPARLLVVTGSRVALAKRQSIERREHSVLLRFSAAAGRQVRDEFSVGEEFGFVLNKRET
ncbi:MAG TPA: hypothetical protein VK581_07095 [Chthoniobacterales bacterium]|nr:hypothetical protein [Chthoniobacterales bacterium]